MAAESALSGTAKLYDPTLYAGSANQAGASAFQSADTIQQQNDQWQTILSGIGKTSLAIYAKHVASKPNPVLKTDFRFAVAYYTVEKGQNLADVCAGLTSKLLDSVGQSMAAKCFERLKKLKLHFGVHLPGVGELKVEPGEEQHTKTRLYGDFDKAIRELIAAIPAQGRVFIPSSPNS